MNGTRPIDLHVPRTRTLQLALPAGEAPADAAARSEVRIFVVDASGAPRPGARVVLRASVGTVELVRELGPGLYASAWSVPREREATDSLEAFLEEAPRLVSKAALRRLAGPAAVITLSPSRSRLVAGEPEVVVDASLVDAAGNPARDELRAAVNAGNARVEPLAGGAARVHLKVPAELGGVRTLQLACTSARGAATASLGLPISPAAPAQARLALASLSVPADGRAQVPLRVLVEDKYGNPVEGTTVAAEAEGGRVSAPAALGGGSFGAVYTPPLSREPGSALVRVRAGAAVNDLRVPLRPSQAPFAISPKLGGLTNLGRVTSPVLSLEAALRFEALGAPFAALVESSWFFAAHSDSLVAGGQPLDARTRTDFVSLATGLSYRPFVLPRTQAIFTVAPSLLLQRGTQRFAGQPSLTQGAVTPGLMLSTGAELRLGRFVPLAELRWSWHRDAGLFSVQNPVRGVALLVGSRFELQ